MAVCSPRVMLKHYYFGYFLNCVIMSCFLILFYQNRCPKELANDQEIPPECPIQIKEVIKEVPREIIQEVPKEVIKTVYVTTKQVNVTPRPKISFCPKDFRGTHEVIRHCLPQETTELIIGKMGGKKLPKRTIYVIMKGRLGNHMFQMLGSYMLSYLMGTRLVFVTDSIDITRIFPLFKVGEEKIKIIKPKIAGLVTVNDSIGVSPSVVASNVLKYINTGDVVLDNYMIDHAYIDHAKNGECRKLLKDFFQFSCEDNEAAYNFLHLLKQQWLIGRPDIKPDNVTYVGIQVRRGDYTDKMWYDRGMRIPGKDYFFRAMKYFKDQFKNVIFVVATNDRPWCYDNIITEGVYLSPQFSSASEDMALLSHCNHTIGSVGSFTLWSSLLTGGLRTVYSISKQREYIPAYGNNY